MSHESNPLFEDDHIERLTKDLQTGEPVEEPTVDFETGEIERTEPVEELPIHSKARSATAATNAALNVKDAISLIQGKYDEPINLDDLDLSDQETDELEEIFGTRNPTIEEIYLTIRDLETKQWEGSFRRKENVFDDVNRIRELNPTGCQQRLIEAMRRKRQLERS